MNNKQVIVSIQLSAPDDVTDDLTDDDNVIDVVVTSLLSCNL